MFVLHCFLRRLKFESWSRSLYLIQGFFLLCGLRWFSIFLFSSQQMYLFLLIMQKSIRTYSSEFSQTQLPSVGILPFQRWLVKTALLRLKEALKTCVTHTALVIPIFNLHSSMINKFLYIIIWRRDEYVTHLARNMPGISDSSALYFNVPFNFVFHLLKHFLASLRLYIIRLR